MQNIVFLAVAFHSFTSWLQFEQYLTTGLVVYKAFWNNLWTHLNLLGDECLKRMVFRKPISVRMLESHETREDIGLTQPAITCSKLAIETLELGVKL